MAEAGILTSTSGGGCDTCVKFTNQDLVGKLLDGLDGKLDRLLQATEKNEKAIAGAKAGAKEQDLATKQLAICSAFRQLESSIKQTNLSHDRRADKHPTTAERNRAIQVHIEAALNSVLAEVAGDGSST